MYRKGRTWLAQAVSKHNVIRRKKKSVDQFASYKLLLEYCRLRGFHLVETGEQYIVICNDAFFRLHL